MLAPMINARPAGNRGRTQIDWLDSRHTFSFGDYYDPAAMGFRVLRVLNDDRVLAGAGFPTHGHRDMEIISYVLEGALAHKDSLGTGSVIRPGDVQRMTAGTGVRHSEFNDSRTESVHFLQIWILPERAGLAPGYQQQTYPEADRRGRFRLVAARDGRDGAVTIHQDCSLFASVLGEGEQATYVLPPGRFAYLHVARGRVTLKAGENDRGLAEGDGAEIGFQDGTAQTIEVVGGQGVGEVLLFDLP
jgi:redox-sensitive bicupin YhaK (pirin superfamily)